LKRHASSRRIEIVRRTEQHPNPRALRDSLGMTAKQFADTYGIAVGTVRDWDCGRYRPDRTACAYLRRIARWPDLMREEKLR